MQESSVSLPWSDVIFHYVVVKPRPVCCIIGLIDRAGPHWDILFVVDGWWLFSRVQAEHLVITVCVGLRATLKMQQPIRNTLCGNTVRHIMVHIGPTQQSTCRRRFTQLTTPCCAVSHKVLRYIFGNDDKMLITCLQSRVTVHDEYYIYLCEF